jgi:hypothetical protein
VLKFDWTSFVVPGGCLVGGLKIRLLLRALVALFLMFSPLVLAVVHYMVSYCWWYARVAVPAERASTPFANGIKVAALRALPYVIFISFCLVQVVSTGIFSAWDCREFMDDTATGSTKRFLREDMSVQCGSDEHEQIQSVAYVFFAIWPVGMPLTYLLALLACRGALTEGRSTLLTHATSFLHEDYTISFFWWEV